MRLIGPGMAKLLPLTVVCMGLAAVAATGLPPFGLFFSEMTVLNGGFAAGRTVVSTLVLAALLAAFCGILYQLTRILLGAPKVARTSDARRLGRRAGDGADAGRAAGVQRVAARAAARA